MEAEKSLNELASKIVIHNRGGVGIKDVTTPETLKKFVEDTDGVAYFDFEGTGWGVAYPKLSSKEFNLKNHKYAVAVGKIESNDWEEMDKRGNITLLRRGFSKKALIVSPPDISQPEPQIPPSIFNWMTTDDVD